MEHRMKELSTDLPSCCYLHEWGYKKFPSSNGILHLYIALAQVRKKRQIRSSLLLDMPRSDNHETPSWRNFCEQRIHHSFVEMEMQPTAPTQSSLCIWHSVCSWVFLSLRETSAIEQRQSIGQSWNPSSIYQSIIGKQASRKISTMMIHVLTSCPPRSAFL